MAGAVAVWLYCSRLFSRIGKGTPFINEPPKHLVTSGLYSHSRNPIYVAHVAFLLGWFLGSGCVALLPYTGVIIVLLHAFIVRWEEPGLRERFGEDYVRYTQTVPRWLFLRPRSRV
jgi:protein-S-isoprenylcysteine O-methyltransferase Ste14